MFQFKLANSGECFDMLRNQAREWNRIVSVYQDLGELWNRMTADRHLFPDAFTVAYSRESNVIHGSALARTFSISLTPASQGENLRGCCTITLPNALKDDHGMVGRFFLDQSGIIYEESGEEATQENIYNNGGWLLLGNVFYAVATFSEQTGPQPNA